MSDKDNSKDSEKSISATAIKKTGTSKGSRARQAGETGPSEAGLMEAKGTTDGKRKLQMVRSGLDEAISDILEENEALRTEVKQMKEQTETLVKDNEAVTTKLKEEISELDKQNGALKTKMEDAAKTNKNLISKLEADQLELQVKMDAITNEKDSEIRAYERRNSQLQDELNKTRDEMQSLRNDLSLSKALANKQNAKLKLEFESNTENLVGHYQQQLNEMKASWDNESRQMQEAMDSLMTESARNVKKLEDQLEAERASFAKQLSEVYEASKKNLNAASIQADKSKTDADTLRRENVKLKEAFCKSEGKRNLQEAAYKKLKQDTENVNQELERTKTAAQHFKRFCEALVEDVSSLEEAYNSTRLKLDQQTLSLERRAKENQELLKERQNLTLRLVKDTSPPWKLDIEDLSDICRPTKLGELFCELYDNEWTDAYEELVLMTKMSDAGAVAELLQILHETASICSTIASDRLNSLKQAMKVYKYVWQEQQRESMTHELNITNEAWEMILRSNKEVAIKMQRNVSTMVLSIVKQRLNISGSKSVDAYIRACADLCWVMAVQDPPIIVERLDLQEDKPVAFDKYRYRPYTKTGKYYSFIVWPALLLHANGPLLAKGVAQGK